MNADEKEQYKKELIAANPSLTAPGGSPEDRLAADKYYKVEQKSEEMLPRFTG